METPSYVPVPPGVGMEDNFFSLDDILLSHERLPSRMECLFPRLGFLEKSSDSRDIQEGTKMEMPLFLAKGLYERKRRVVSVELPKVYKEGWRTVFSADPTVVDLHKMGPYYYGLGSQMLHFDSPENPEIAQAILQCCAEWPPGGAIGSNMLGHFQKLMSVSPCLPLSWMKSNIMVFQPY
ncbi:DNA replication complex GINS protein PSF3 isoform X2 [Esox lucius]|uniref:DNA replication complex GINS protein PSF3 isoform X2 n=1 Tax=Esox lucius TaxID=8010 RepID=UPI0009732381|nr:DNA replication complex GINS protein PSF3 isoform X2 [Esox lucius]